MMLGYIGFNYWLFAIPGLLLGIYAQIKLSSTYRRYIEVETQNGVTGAQAARVILDDAGLSDVPIEEVGGHLTDHYEPTRKALFLSSENFHGHSVAAVGVSAHEAGHALQHKAAYAPLHLRMWLVPVTQFASGAAQIIFLLGMFMSIAKFVLIAVVVFAVLALFQLVTLPVEFDASRRAKVQLLSLGLINPEEGAGAGRVLNAAALTYVAAMVSALLQLLYFIMLARGNDRD